MKDHLYTEHLIEEKVYVDDIPIIRFNLKGNRGKVPTIILYHGWSSNKESQRLRGFILANLGFQVIIPDAVYHGERNRLENYEAENSVKYFWPTIINNIDESKILIDYSVEHFNADKERIGIIGHSMGGFTAAGVFTFNKHIKTCVVLNGSFNWRYFNQILKESMGIDDDRFKNEEDKLDSIDPINNLNSLIDRPILLLHAEKDSVVNIQSQKVFYERIQPQYSDKSLIQLIEYSNLDHFVTTNMMEDAAIWFKKFL